MTKEMREKGYFMINSSYLHAADPNSMRNFGHFRNSIYNFAPESDYDMQSASTHTTVSKASSKFDLPKGFNRNVRPNDYTKNISEPLFQPGLLSAD